MEGNNNIGMITYYIMTREKVEKQGRDDHCELSHKTALHTVLLARTIVQHRNFYFHRFDESLYTITHTCFSSYARS